MLRAALLSLLIVFIARAFWRVIDGLIQGLAGRGGRRQFGRSVPMVRDPVCGTFLPADRALMLVVGSKPVFFCSAACRDRYPARTA